MEQQITNVIVRMSRSYHELAKIIQAERQVTVHMAQLIGAIPDHPVFREPEVIMEHAAEVSDSITAYLNNLADLEDAIAENLTSIMGEMKEHADE